MQILEQANLLSDVPVDRLKDHARRVGGLVPMREVTALLEPTQPG